ncbi:MAG TPA: hypothetical protein VM187_00640, partial [Niastella sp.]|nr:hypothetical protein [Niastella sp.]
SLGRLVGETSYWARPAFISSEQEKEYKPRPPFTDTLKTFREIKYNSAGEIIYDHNRQGTEAEWWIQKQFDAKTKTWQQACLTHGNGKVTYYRTDSVKGYSRRVEMDEGQKITQTRIREYNPDGSLRLQSCYDHTRPKLRDSLLVACTRYVFHNIEGKTRVETMVYDWPKKKRNAANIILHHLKIYDSNSDEVIFTDLLNKDPYNHTLFYSYVYSGQKLLQKVIMSSGYTGKSKTLYYVKYTFWED